MLKVDKYHNVSKSDVFIINYADGPGFKVKDTSAENDTNNPAGKQCGRVAPSDTEVGMHLYADINTYIGKTVARKYYEA